MFHDALPFFDRLLPVFHLPRQVKSASQVKLMCRATSSCHQQDHRVHSKNTTRRPPDAHRVTAREGGGRWGGGGQRPAPSATPHHTALNSGALPPLSQPHESSSGLDVTSRLKSSSAEGRCAGSAVSVALTRLTRMRRKEQRVLLGGGEL